MSEDTAYLSNEKDCISFRYKDKTIRFRGPYSLTRFESVSLWDRGYMVVNVLYGTDSHPVEDYIDLNPILDDLYIDRSSFLNPIKKVEVCNA